MIQFSFCKYKLEPVSNIGALAADGVREGALLRCVWPDDKVGYGDCFPWPELGDVDIDTHLHALSRGRLSTLMEQTIWLARKDAAMRALLKNGLQGAVKIKNHYLVNDPFKLNETELNNIKAAGYTTIKVKVGRDLEEESKIIVKSLKSNNLMLRLDFNSKADFSQFERFMVNFDTAMRRRIEYIEDPFAFDQKAWAEASRLAPLAVDHEYENIDWAKMVEPPFRVIVIKPARQDVDKAIHRCTTFGLRATVTSSLDHPLGVMHAAIVAAELKKDLPNTILDCGLLSLKTYKPNEFTNKIIVQGPYITQVQGMGVGFDTILEHQQWEALEFQV